MNKLLLHLFLGLMLLTLKPTFGQEIKWGNIHTSKKNRIKPTILSSDSLNFYFYYKQGRKIKIASYSRNLYNVNYEKELPKLKYDNRRILVDKVTFLNDKFVLFCHQLQLNSNGKYNYQTIIYTINKENGNLDPDPIKLIESPFEGYYQKPQIYFSPRKTKFLIKHRAHKRKQEKLVIQFTLFDSKFNKIEELTESINEPPNPSNKKRHLVFKDRNLILDEEGSIYYLKGLQHFVSFDANKNYEKWEEEIEIDEASPNSKIKTLSLAFDKTGNIILFGFYQDYAKGTKSRVKENALVAQKQTVYEGGLRGVFYLKLDYLTKEVLESNVDTFSDEFLKNFKTKKDKKKESKGQNVNVANNFNLVDLLPQNDNSLLVIAEVFTHKTTITSSSHREKIIYGGVASISLDSIGNINWVQYINKKQKFWQAYNSYTANGSFLGGIKVGRANTYKYTKHFGSVSGVLDGKLFVLFNNHQENKLNADNPKTLTLPLQFSIVHAHVYDTETGQVKSKIIKNSSVDNLPLTPSIFYRTDDGKSVIVFAQRKKSFKFGEVLLSN